MSALEAKFAKLGTEHAPGQEVRQGDPLSGVALRGGPLPGVVVDFSHGDVNDTGFPPAPGALDAFIAGEHRGGAQAYTEYRGGAQVREQVAQKLAAFTGRPISAAEELIITPGTQGALFLALGAAVNTGDRVAIVQPDYFANRKLVVFLGAEVVPVRLDYLAGTGKAGLDLAQLTDGFKSGVRTFLFSNPNNPTGGVYSAQEITAVAELANRYGVTVIADELYARLVYSGQTHTHICAAGLAPDKVLTILGPSKTESLSGYRLGVAFGAAHLIERAEKLQAIVSLRAPGYSQAVLSTWFDEPEGWLAERTARHQAIRDDLIAVLRTVPELALGLHDFVRAVRLQANAVVTPGTEFSPDATDSIRLNFSQSHQAAVQAAQRIAELIERYRE